MICGKMKIELSYIMKPYVGSLYDTNIIDMSIFWSLKDASTYRYAKTQTCKYRKIQSSRLHGYPTNHITSNTDK